MASPFPTEEKDPALVPYLPDPTYNRGFIIPPQISFSIHVVLSRATSMVTKTRPHLTFPDVWVNQYRYYKLDMMGGRWIRVHPWLLWGAYSRPRTYPPL